MKRLIVMRHAKSDWGQGLSDHARPLNKRGRESAAALGNWLREQGLQPDEALVSTSRRTRETWDLLGLEVPARYEERLYLAEADTLRRALSDASGDTVLVLAHNPGIAEFAADCVTRPPDHPRFDDYPTGATLVVGFDASDWAEAERGTVLDFVVPRALL